MEFLIIVFVIISIISSLTKNIKRHMKRDSSFDPWSFESDYMKEKNKNVKVVIEKERNSIEDEIPGTELPEKKENLQETYSEIQTVESYDFQPQTKMSERVEASVSQGDEKEEILTKDDIDLERELKVLLTGEKLPFGIVVSEVLGLPRALKPYGYRKT